MEPPTVRLGIDKVPVTELRTIPPPGALTLVVDESAPNVAFDVTLLQSRMRPPCVVASVAVMGGRAPPSAAVTYTSHWLAWNAVPVLVLLTVELVSVILVPVAARMALLADEEALTRVSCT